MIMLSRGLRRGQRRSWFVAVSLLAVTVVAHAAARRGTISRSRSRGYCSSCSWVSAATSRRRPTAPASPTHCPASPSSRSWRSWPRRSASRPTVRHHLPTLGVVFIACAERLVGQYDIALPDRRGRLRRPHAPRHRGLAHRLGALLRDPTGRRSPPLDARRGPPSDAWPKFALARSSGATARARSTTSPCATTSSSSSSATPSSPTPSTAAWPWSRPTPSAPTPSGPRRFSAFREFAEGARLDDRRHGGR